MLKKLTDGIHHPVIHAYIQLLKFASHTYHQDYHGPLATPTFFKTLVGGHQWKKRLVHSFQERMDVLWGIKGIVGSL